MNISAIYHTSTDNFCYPLNKDELVINIQTGYDIDKVELVYGDPFDHGIFGGSDSWNGNKLEITQTYKLETHKLWQAIIKPQYKRCRYHFILHSKDEIMYMLEDRFMSEEDFKAYNGRRQDFFFPWMNPADIITPASWVNNTIWYQIFPDRFCNSGKNTGKKFKKWSAPDQKVTNLDYFGGDIKGIKSKLDYLKNLGITGIYFTPMTLGKSVHKYDTADYMSIDNDFGTDEDMKHLVSEAHKRGIRVMLDGVFNHSGKDFKPWLDVLENGEKSEYYDWFMINKAPKKVGMLTNNARKGNYYTFAFFDGMPKLNTNNQKVVDYFIDVCTHWVRDFDIDAIRLDVANEISHDFCKQLRKALFKLKPDFYICGEIWHNSMPWLRGDEFDSVMNYSLQESIDSFWANKNITSLDFEHQINRCINMYPQQVNNVMFNLLDSHDTMRLITRCKNNEDIFYQKLCTLFAMNGTCCIYYGTEVALEGGYDPDCRRCMPWNEIENGNYDITIKNVKSIIAMRKEYDELRSGKIRFLDSKNDRVIIFEKYSDKRAIKIILNCSDCEINIDTNYSDILFSRGFSNNKLAINGVAVII